jgi:anti-sigma factor RsiW
MTCHEAEPLLHAYLDGELDLSASLDIEKHLQSCGECSDAYRKFELLRAEIADADLDFASDAMLARVRGAVERQAGLPVRMGRGSPWRNSALLAAAAAAVVLAFVLPWRNATGHNAVVREIGDREIVDSHIRSLQTDHLFDVASSDRHTVKPWFQGKLDFAPQVPDLSAKGFVLVGGRLDVIDAHKVAALVYKRREHVINLWISQGSAARTDPEQSDVDGFHIVRWSKNGMTYRAVSDLDMGELRGFADLVRAE